MSDSSEVSNGDTSAPMPLHVSHVRDQHLSRHEAISRVSNADLVLGGINLHEDLHFSTYYLRASLPPTTGRDYPGYSHILAVYDAGNEQYFIIEREAERTSRWLINRCVANPRWLAGQLKAIEYHSRRLVQAFPENATSSSFRALRTEDLVAIYLRHHVLHTALYRYARIPEALDRGRPFFSDYLREYLREVGTPAAELSAVFQALTMPSEPSIIAEAERAFDDIAAAARDACPELSRSHTAHMFLPPSVREALRNHRAQWGWLSYHGYRNPALPTELDYVQRLVRTLSNVSVQRIDQSAQTERSVAAFESIYRRIDPQHKELFRLFGEIGRVKLLRRYFQLRNFYFLDMLLAECARRLDAAEWQVRCCFPEELVASLRIGCLDTSIKGRSLRCAVIYSPMGEYVLDDAEIAALFPELNIKRQQSNDSAVRYGTPACVGFARGNVRIVDQSYAEGRMFSNGDVLVCMAADPDLVPLIRESAAVVTQQGGVTSHASVLCREIGVPTIIGVEDLLDFVHDGDEVEVDASHGTVRIVARSRRAPQNVLVVPEEFWDQPERVGMKAANLRVASTRGFKVPPYTLLWFDDVAKMLRQGEAQLRAAFLQLCTTLDSSPRETPSFLLRSSAFDEDSQQASRAGRYFSAPLSIAADPLQAVRDFVTTNQDLGYRGVVILQRFLHASVSGVSVDCDALADAEHRLVVECVQGPLNTVTSGQGFIERLVFDRISGEMVVPTTGTLRSTLSNLPAAQLIEWLSSLSAAFGRPTYTEWGYFGSDYWLYQIRTTVSHSLARDFTV